MRKFNSAKTYFENRELFSVVEPLLRDLELTRIDRKMLWNLAKSEYLKAYSNSKDHMNEVENSFTAVWNEYCLLKDKIHFEEQVLEESLKLLRQTGRNKKKIDDNEHRAYILYDKKRRLGFTPKEASMYAYNFALLQYRELLRYVINNQRLLGRPSKDEVHNALEKYDKLISDGIPASVAFDMIDKEMYANYRKEQQSIIDQINYKRYGAIVSSFGGRHRERGGGPL